MPTNISPVTETDGMLTFSLTHLVGLYRGVETWNLGMHGKFIASWVQGTYFPIAISKVIPKPIGPSEHKNENNRLIIKTYCNAHVF